MNKSIKIIESKFELEPKSKTNQWGLFTKVVSRTMIVLFCIFALLFIFSIINSSDEDFKKAANERALSPETLNKLNPALGRFYSQVAKTPFSKKFMVEVSHLVDQAFLPVYQNIPQFADMHYSVIGEYTQIGAAATGQLASSIQKLLFPSLDERLMGVTNQVNDMILNELQQKVSKHINATIQQEQIPSTERLIFENLLAQELKRNITKTLTSVSENITPSGASNLIAIAIARTLLVKLGVKLTAKLAMRSTGVVAGAATGAAAGTLLIPIPVVGTMVGAVVGAGSAWLAIDVAIISVDEWLNRDEFENDLQSAITEQKEMVKQDILRKANLIKTQIVKLGKKSIVGKTPASL